jgi:alkylhydroperoxidase/carboxymuconolactone decarboxylase family protein YurZ
MTDDAPVPLPDPETLRARLTALRAGRGFLLPHHGALAAGAPELHAAYLEMYRALTLRPRHLDPLTKESVWLAILTVAREAVGTHHLDLFRSAGGSVAQAQALIAMAGFAAASDALRFAAEHWAAALPGLDPAAAYADGLDRLNDGALAPEAAELAMLAAQAARHDAAGTAHHLRRAYALGIPEERITEALSYLIWPRGVNCFLDACTVWHDLMASGAVTPSPRFRVWAEMPGLGAWDPEGGTAPGGFDTPTRD